MAISEQIVELKIATQKNYFYSGVTQSLEFRKDMLVRLKKAIQTYETEIMEALQKDLGKHPFESYVTEVGFVLSSIAYTLKHLEEWMQPELVQTPLHLQPAKSFIIREPYGSVLIIGPFNYPFQLVMDPLIGAIAGGNCAIVKPSEHAVHTGKWIKKIITDIFPPAYIQVVEGGVKETSALIHAPFDYLFFTGSVQVGKIVMKAAAERLTPLTLELGGKSPAIVDQTADLDKAAERIVWGKFVNNGQTCVAPDYVVVHQSVHDLFFEKLVQTIQQFYGKDAAKSSDYGRIIHQKHFDRLQMLLHQERDFILYGGKTNREDLYIEPTVLGTITWDRPIMEDEIFGPILPILTYDHLGQLIHRLQRLPKPLAAYFFTENKQAENFFIENLSFGGGCINDTIAHVGNIHLPFGGVGTSGMNAYHGKASFETFTHAKSMMKKNTTLPMRIAYPPYDHKLPFVKRLIR